jgi:hypothetical protein
LLSRALPARRNLARGVLVDFSARPEKPQAARGGAGRPPRQPAEDNHRLQERTRCRAVDGPVAARRIRRVEATTGRSHQPARHHKTQDVRRPNHRHHSPRGRPSLTFAVACQSIRLRPGAPRP